MKKLMYFCSPLLALFLVAIPAAAQKNRSNKSGAERGDARADQVQAENKGKHKAKGHRHPLHPVKGSRRT